MKTPFASVPSVRFLLGFILALAASVTPTRAQVAPQLNPDQLDQLLGPIALYPDALVALILPASTVSTDIVLAQRYLSAGGDPEQIDNQPWNESVKALARYPMLIQWLDENLTWTQQLGTTFLNQPDSVMESVQRLRAKAKANGTLTSTPQQKLVLDGDVIEIVPAQPDVIYVPYYDPAVVYGAPVYYGGPPFVTFGVGFTAGYWLAYDCNWRSRAIVVGDRHHNWYEHRDWKRPPGPGGRPNYGNNWRPWTPPARMPSYSRPDSHRPPGVVQPRPFPRNPSTPGHYDRPRTNNPPRDNTHNRPPGSPPNGAAPTGDNRNHRPPQAGPGPQNSPQAHPQPGPTNSNPPPRNSPRPSGPTTPPNVRPQPDADNPRPNPGPPQPGPVLTRPTGSQPPAPTPGAVPPSHPGGSRPVPSAPPPPRPPPAPKDQPRDEKPTVQN